MQHSNQDAMVNRLLSAAQAEHAAGRFDRAMAIYVQAMALAPWRVEPYLGRGVVCFTNKRYDEALYWFERARGIAPDAPRPLEGVGRALLAFGRSAEALEVFQRLQVVDAKSSMGFHGAGEALQQLGRLKEARAALEHAVALAPDAIVHHFVLARIARFVENDPRLAGLERLKDKAASWPELDQCQLHFALGKAYDELDRYAEAFEQWRTANTIMRRRIAYDESLFLGNLHDLAAAFTSDVMATRRGAGDPSEVPVFVVGMPRSGTTLVEQIIGSHPDAFGAGEKMYLLNLLGLNLAGAKFPAYFASVSNEDMRKLGTLYVTRLKVDVPQAARIVDKLPVNFMHCGLIHLILPNARIIHVKRDPLDTCLSCYANMFSHNIDYSYDLGELGRYYRAYETLMAHWRRVLPERAMLEVQYEELIADFPAQARRIVDYCGLAWDDRCLSFQKTENTVSTLSAAQVRQPLYKSAIGRARHYREWLEPLLRELQAAEGAVRTK